MYFQIKKLFQKGDVVYSRTQSKLIVGPLSTESPQVTSYHLYIYIFFLDST